jgi:hypothetical protein
MDDDRNPRTQLFSSLLPTLNHCCENFKFYIDIYFTKRFQS